MVRSGAEYIEGLRDGRAVYVNGERVSDVTAHPAFAAGVRSVAHLYDLASRPDMAEIMTYPSPTTGHPINRAWKTPRSAEDLRARRRAIGCWADASYGLIGRSPDHVASFFAGFAGSLDIFARGGQRFADNLQRFYDKASQEDLYLAYTIVHPQIDRSKPAHQQPEPHLFASVAEERSDGIVVRGAMMVGTGAVMSDYIFLSCILPLRPGDEDYAISVVVPNGAPGVKIMCRRPYAQGQPSVFDYPLSTRFDETDSLIVFDDVFVPWEHVFIYRDIVNTRAQFYEGPAHLIGNHQAQVRFISKLKFLVGLARRVCVMTGAETLPQVQAQLGELAARAALVEGLVVASETECLIDQNGVARPNPAFAYANMTVQSSLYPEMLQIFRDLAGGGLIALPSSAADFANPEIAAQLERYVQSPGTPSREKVKLMKLAWEMIGSEFAGRHLLYEMFYAGAPFVVKGHAYRTYDWASAEALVQHCLDGYGLPA